MKKSYRNAGLTRLRTLGLTALLAGAAATAQAQIGYTAPNVTNTLGTYTDLGTTGTAIPTANTDDANSIAQGIGFPFTFNGTVFTQVVLNTNGFIKLGAAAPTGPAYTDGSQSTVNGPVDGPDTNLLLIFNQDLQAGAAGTEYRVATTGITPNRVCTIQWKNVQDKPRFNGATTPVLVGTQYANFSFQIQLFEVNNSTQFVYGTATPGAVADDFAKFVSVGIKGSSAVAGNLILGTKASATPWAQTAFVGAPYTGNAHNVRGTQLPQAGRTYTFSIPVANDVATQIIYGFSKLAVPGSNPVELQALVRNAGTAATVGPVTVTLSVTGANTYTATQVVPSLGTTATTSTALVTFAAVPLPNLGNNTITVSVPLDGNNNNNAQTEPLVTNATTISLIKTGVPPVSASGFGAGAQDNYFGAKFRLTQSRDVAAVNAFFFNEPAAVGNTAYGVLIDATTGTLLGRSANFVVTTASLNQLHTFTLTAPITVPAGDVIVGMATVAATPASPQFFLMGVQGENPNRSGTYYTGSATTAAAPTVALNAANTRVYRYMLEMVTAAPATCPTAGNIAIANVTTTSASVSFTGPGNGTAYQVVYVPAGTTPTATSPTAASTASPINLTGLMANTGYDVYVRVLCGATDQSQLAGPVFFSTPCIPAIVQNFPYAENFDVIARGQDLPCGITVADINADGATWNPTNSVTVGTTTSTVFRSGPYAMVYAANPAAAPQDADDWVFLPAMRFVGARSYRLAFWYRGFQANVREALEVKYGNAATPAGQTNLLYTNRAINSPTYAQATNASTPALADLTPATTGVYYIGFHAISPADLLFMAVDDVTVTAVLSSSAALNRAVNVYPNPSNTGSFNLDIRGANAQGTLTVEVTNMLGQRVYTGAAKDNFANRLDLSYLANGIYTLKIRNGGEYVQQQLSIVK